MPKYAKPQWGRLGVYEVLGAGLTDAQMAPTEKFSETNPSHRGFLHTDEQFKTIAEAAGWSPRQIAADFKRPQLDFVREFYLRSALSNAQLPGRAELNAALRVMESQFSAFLEATAAFSPPLSWDFGDPGDASRYSVFLSLSARLRSVATMAAYSSARSENHLLRMRFEQLHECATQTANFVDSLDLDSQIQIFAKLPAGDYGSNTIGKLREVISRVDNATRAVHLAGKKRGGPRPAEELTQIVSWLAPIYELGGKAFTRNPNVKTRYTGRAQSPAAPFVTEFLKLCGSRFRPGQIDFAMAKVVKGRK